MELKLVRFRKTEVIELLSILPSLKQRGQTGLDLALELETRLEACNQAGGMVKELYTWGEDIEHIATSHGFTTMQTKKYIEQAICYISGWSRKKRTFKHFIQHIGKGKRKVWVPQIGTERLVGGYAQVFVGNDFPGVPKSGWMYKHRLVMQKYLGRPLKSWEVIHHKDRNKLNNEVSNLKVLSHVEHPVCIRCPYYEFYLKQKCDIH